MDDLRQELLEHADGQPASPRLLQALQQSPELREQLEQARSETARLRATMAPMRLSPQRAKELARGISSKLPGRVHTLWRVGIAAAAAACLVIVAGGLWLTRDNSPRPERLPVAAKEHNRVWRVVRCAPTAQAAVLHREQSLNSGETLELGALEYATISETGGAQTCLALPGSKLSANGQLTLERGSVEARPGTPIGAAGKTYRAQSAFLISVSGANTQLEVYADVVTQESNGQSRALRAGRHLEGSAHDFAGVEERAAYARGFEAWQRKDWVVASQQFRVAATSDQIDTQSRNYAHFYWFAAAGSAGEKPAAIEIGEGYLARYPSDAHLDYVRYFIGLYLHELNRPDAARKHLQVVAHGADGTLRDLALGKLAELDGDGQTKPAALWQEFLTAWQARDFARGEECLRILIESYPTETSVNSGDAAFRLFSCVGNQGRFEEALTLVDKLIAKHPGFHANDYALYFKAYYLSQLKRPREALAALDALAASYPQSSMRQFAEDLRKELKK
ncbi:MAG: tetratricopeptide repeat protein [Planctomycetes bacterium]|nr:tetratricopeptide repeat protein [Planctomycetota bacterium]